MPPGVRNSQLVMDEQPTTRREGTFALKVEGGISIFKNPQQDIQLPEEIGLVLYYKIQKKKKKDPG